MKDYDPENYWASRYEHFSITSSGHADLPIEYNAWLYKMKLRKIGKAALEQCHNFSDLKVIELGCGTGVYVEMWKNLGVHDLTGVDIAPNVIEHLKKQFPEFLFYSEDLSDETLASRHGGNCYDIVTAIGVLVHIVDDELFCNAIRNIAGLTKNDGVVLISEYMVRSQPVAKSYMKFRSIDWFYKTIDDAGLEIIKQVPLYFFMINPFDTPSFVGKFILPRIFSLTTIMIRRFPKFTGGFLYCVDLLITRILNQGPSEKLFVCRKKN